MTNYEVLEDIQKTAIQLIMKEQFYGHFFNHLIREVVDEKHHVQTAAICIDPQNNLLKLIVNNNWWAKKIYSSNEEEYKNAKYWTIKHEILHILFKHIFNWNKYGDKEIANIAFDFVVHQCIELHKIPKHLQPSLALIENFKEFFPDAYKGGNDSHRTTDYYYKILLEQWKDTQEQLRKGEEGQQSQSGQGQQDQEQSDNQSDGESDQSNESQEGQKSEGDESNNDLSNNSAWNSLNNSQKNLTKFMTNPNNKEMHGTWKDISKLDKGKKEFANSWVDNTIREVANKLDRSSISDRNKWRGTLPAGLVAYIDELIASMTPSVNWRRYLRRFAANGQRSYLKTTIKKRSKRFGTIPGIRIKTECKVLIAIDTSGSVDNESLAEFFSEIRWIWKSKADVKIVECDTEIGKIWNYKGKFPGEITGRGGTDFNAPVIYANKEYKPDVMIYFTDGYAPPPIKSKAPIMWLICKEGGKEVEEMEEFQGIKIKMDF